MKLLQNKIYNDELTKDPKIFVELVENEIDGFLDFKFTEREEYIQFIRLLSDYAIMLSKAGYFRKSLQYLKISTNFIQTDIELQNKDLLDEPLYEALIFNRGVSQFRLNNYFRANKDFKRLVNKFSTDDIYKNWLTANSIKKWIRIEWFFTGLTVISLMFSFILKPENGLIDRIAPYNTFIWIFCAIWVRIKRKRLERKRINNAA